MSRPESGRSGDEPPTLQMVLSGGVGVVAVVAFVTAIAFGTDIAEVAPGARLGIASAEGPIGLAVLVPRCRGERVMSVELLDADGAPVWRVASTKGAIDDRYVVGAEETPFATTTEIELRTPLPSGPVTAVASLDGESLDVTDRVTFDPSSVPADGVLYQGAAIGTAEFQAQAAGAADCSGPTDDLGLVSWLFIAAGLGVVVTYVMMLMRYLDGRTPSR